VPVAIDPDRIGRNDHDEEMVIKLGSIGGCETTGAEMAGYFSASNLCVRGPIVTDIIIAIEDPTHVIGKRFRIIDREPA
jgi:hypothetical protein